MRTANPDRRVTGQQWCKPRDHPDWPPARSAAAMRDAESLVKIQVTNIRADVPGSAKTNLSVHVCAIHVDQCSGGVDFRAYCFDGLLEDSVGRRIRDHQSGESLAV